MLVLLIIFMVTAPMLHQGVAVALPKTATTNLPSSVEDPIILSITREGLYYINETPVARGLLKDRLGAFLRMRKDRTVFLKADRALSYGTVVETLDVLNRMGIENLGMITETPTNRKTAKLGMDAVGAILAEREHEDFPWATGASLAVLLHAGVGAGILISSRDHRALRPGPHARGAAPVGQLAARARRRSRARARSPRLRSRRSRRS